MIIPRKILVCVVAVIVATVLSVNVSGQELAARKHGTVMEQLQQANIHNDVDPLVKELLNYAFAFKGVRYRSGMSSPKGFDCSGFTSFVFKKFGYDLNRSSSAQISDGERVERSELQPGDLVFFNGRAVGKRIGHVGIVTEVNKDDNTFKFIHAACSKGITESKSTEPYYSRRYMGACRVLDQE